MTKYLPKATNALNASLMKGFNAQIIRNLLNRLDDYGIEAKQALKEVNLPLNEETQTLPIAPFGNFLEQLCAAVQDNRLGLKIGFESPLSTLGIMGQVYQSCANFGQVLEKMELYIGLLDNVNSYTYHIHKDKIFLQTIGDKNFRLQFPLAERQIVEHNIGFSLRCKKEYLGREIHPVEIWSPYPKTGEIDLLENYFNCPVWFDKPYMAVVLPVEMLDWKIPTASPEALLLFEQYCNRLLEQKNNWSVKVKQCIIKNFQIKLPTLSVVARQMHISERTLQRYLKQEENSFQLLLDEVRLEMAKLYLKQSSMSIQEISDRLGFEVANSFCRFYKLKTGTNPRLAR